MPRKEDSLKVNFCQHKTWHGIHWHWNISLAFEAEDQLPVLTGNLRNTSRTPDSHLDEVC